MKSIYHSELCKQKILDLYDKQMKEIGIPYTDLYVETSFGKTHVIETGNKEGIPLLLLHGGNSTTAYNLKSCDFLWKDFHIYAVDTIGHPGKSDEVSLSPNNYDYGKWLSQVITNLGFEKIRCFGGFFGAGVLVKTMCVAPKKLEKIALLIPGGIKNAPAIKSMNMLFPMIMYWMTGKRKWFIRCILPMAIKEENITEDILITAKCSIDNAKIKKGMPSNVSTKLLSKCNAPTYILAAELDCMFPGKGVLKRAEKVLPNCTTYLLKDRGHIHYLSEKEKESIVTFLS